MVLCPGPYGVPRRGAVVLTDSPIQTRIARRATLGSSHTENLAPVAPKLPHGVLVRGHAGLVINKLTQGVDATIHCWEFSWPYFCWDEPLIPKEPPRISNPMMPPKASHE